MLRFQKRALNSNFNHHITQLLLTIQHDNIHDINTFEYCVYNNLPYQYNKMYYEKINL